MSHRARARRLRGRRAAGMEAARARHPEEIPDRLHKMLDEEFALIRKCDYAYYFLTVHDIVRFARGCDPPILCQGRGSAANSAVCFLLGITSVDPMQHDLLFSRFVSEERREPPDIGSRITRARSRRMRNACRTLSM